MVKLPRVDMRFVVGGLVLLLVVYLIYQQFTGCSKKNEVVVNVTPAGAKVENYEMLDDDGYAAAPSAEELLEQQRLQGPRCGITEGEMMGYKYQIPEELPSVESLMPEETACDSYYDPEAAQDVPYVFTYPLTGAITKTRIEQSGDMWRGDLSIPARDPACDFKTIWNQGDQLLNGAFSNYTYKSQSLVNCDNSDVWVKNAPINVANQELIQDFE